MPKELHVPWASLVSSDILGSGEGSPEHDKPQGQLCHGPRLILCNHTDFKMAELKGLTHPGTVSFGEMKSVLVMGLFLIATSHGCLPNLDTLKLVQKQKLTKRRMLHFMKSDKTR